MQTPYVSQIPIPPCENKSMLESLVKQILTSQTHFETDIASVERKIDNIVYQLYGLTDAEISLIEAQVAR